MPHKLLFTPGPLTTSRRVKEAMLDDLGSRDAAFIDTVRGLRRRLLDLAGVSNGSRYEAVFMQGSGTFGLESAISSTVPRGGRLLVLVNGAYGDRLVRMARQADVEAVALRFEENAKVDPATVDRMLAMDGAVTNVAVVHCETTTGIVNPIRAIGEIVRARGCWYMVDAMSSFGAISVDLEEASVDVLVTSANKCLEGVPGFSIILARREMLESTEGSARSLSLDLQAQWRGFEKNGQFRFTPPTHALLALEQALRELEEEGGVRGRAARYQANHEALMKGMRRVGFQTYLAPEDLSIVITSFLYPSDPRFSFDEFYERLNGRGFVIYPGKISEADCFRIGTIGHLVPGDVELLIDAIENVLREMGVESASPAPEVPA